MAVLNKTSKNKEDSSLYTAFPLDIASRASNLSERILVIDMLNAQHISLQTDVALSTFDMWKVNKLAEKLAGQFRRQTLSRGTPEHNTSEHLARILTAYKLFELNLHSLDDEKSLFAQIHSAWLPTYKHALQEFSPLSDKALAASLYQPETYYGKFAKVCEPFLVQLQRELSLACVKANNALGITMFSAQLIEDIQKHLLSRFELSLAWAVEVDANVYCAHHGIDKTSATSDDYIAYLDATFSYKESYHLFYLRFPTLGRWLAQTTRFLIDNGCMLIERLQADHEEISNAFFDEQITKIRSLKLGKSDYHAGNQSVILVEVELENSNQGTFVYKPRGIQSEVALQRLLDRLTSDGVLHFATNPILAKQHYGYVALIPSGKNHVQSREEAEHIYEELGGYLGLFHVLGGSDIHLENLFIADGHAFICDGETVLGILPFDQHPSLDTILDSVYKTGLLEWPRTPTDEAITEMRISGYAGGEPFQIPFAQPRVNDHRLTFELSVKHEEGILFEPDATNRIYLDGRLTQPEDFKNSILNGFNRVHDWFQREPSEAIQCIYDLFKDTSVRFISRGTQAYTQLLISAQHPKCLMEPLEVDLIINNLQEHLRKWDQKGLMVNCELSSLWQLDIPIFTVHAQSREMVHDYHTVLPMTLQVTPLDYAAQRIKRLSAENRLQQIQYITASLSASEVQSPAFIASAVDYAQQIGWQLCKLLRPPSEQAPWKSFQITAQGISEIDIGTDLYSGSVGIALFLAYLGAITSQQEFRDAAKRALAYSLTCRDKTMIGAFQGLGGLIYLLTHLHHLWKEPRLLDLAVDLTAELSSEISHDREIDVLSGAAGVIPVMIGLAEATSGKGLDCAHRCAQHVLHHAESNSNGLSWPLSRPEEATGNLTGFSHGAGGIGWALISLGCYTNRLDYIEAGRKAFAYEAFHFDANEQDWYDLRIQTKGVTTHRSDRHFANAWCNGASGIGLSRITCWAMLGKNDETLLIEAHRALSATLRNFHQLGNDTLCHGKAGNAELLLRFARLKDIPALHMEANVQAQAQWRNFEKARSWIFGGANVDVFPGLMIGLSGLGMHFLRLAYPEQIPSPLLLDAPQSALT